MDKIRIKEEIHYKMGSIHPMSLRLKKTLANHRGSSPFHFCSKKELHHYSALDKIAISRLKPFFFNHRNFYRFLTFDGNTFNYKKGIRR